MSTTDQAPTRAVVAGATGYLGGHVVRALHRRGAWVRALARDEARLGDARAACDEVVIAQATRPETLGALFEGAEVAFSSVGIRHFHRRPTYEEVDLQANLNLVEAAERAGVRRFVFVSVVEGDTLRTTSPLIDARERVVDRLRASSMTSVILRPTGFFNDMGDFLKMAASGRAWLLGDGTTRINPISGADLAEVAASALLDEAPPADIAVGGPDVYTQREIAALAFEALGTSPRYAEVPAWLLQGAARAIRPFNQNASALALMFSTLATRDATAPARGADHLGDFFAAQAAAQAAR